MKKAPELDPLARDRISTLARACVANISTGCSREPNIVLIAPDLLDTFPDSESVNEALRSLKKVAMRTARPATRKTATASR